ASVSVCVGVGRKEGQENDIQVEMDRPVLDVVEIVLDARAQHVRGLGGASETVDLGPAGDAGRHIEAARVGGDLTSEFVVMRERMWPRTDNRHLASQDVEELRQLIKVAPAQDAPNP